MAEYDGAVRIATPVDTSGFDKGVDRMVKAMRSLTGSVEKLGRTIDKAFSGYVQSLQGAGVATKQVETSLDGAADKTERVSAAADKTAESYGKIAQEAGKAKAALSDSGEAAKKALTDIEESAKATGKSVGAEINGIITQLNTLSKDFESVQSGNLSADSFLLGGWIDGYERAANQLQSLRSRLTSAEESEELPYSESEISKFTQRLYELEEQARASQVEIRNFAKSANISLSSNETAPVITELEAGIKKAETALDKFQAKADKMEAVGASEKAWASIGYDIEKAAEKVFGYAAQVEKLKESGEIDSETYERLIGVLNALQAKAEQVANVAGVDLSHLFGDGAPVDLPNWVSQIEAAEAALQEYQSAVSGMDEEGALYGDWVDISGQIEDAAAEAGELQAALDQLSESGDIDETQYDELSARIADLTGDYDDLQDAVSQSTQDAMPQYLEDWEQMPTLSGMVSDGFERIRNSALTALTAVQHPVQALDRGLALVAQTAIRAGAALLQIARSSILSGLRLIGESAAEAARNITKMSATAVSGGIKRLGGWLSNAAKSMTLFGRSTKRNNDVLKKSLTTILKYGLGVRSFYFLFRKIRQAVAEGYQNLVRYSDTLNQSISGVISSFKRLENQFAASFEPLVNAIAPMIAHAIDKITEATFRAGEFMSALNGQKTVTKAKKVQENYAKSLDKTKKAAKEAERQLAGFDQLNILKKPNEEEADQEGMFEAVPISDEAENLAGEVKDAWVNVDLSGIGEIIGGKIKVALDNIPWPDIKKGAENTGKRLATFLNGLIKVPDLGKSLGKAIADAINAAFAFLDGFVWNFDWKGLGNAIMDTIEAACDNLDWELINHALQGLAIGLADLFNTIFSRVEVWEKIGRTIGKGLNAAVNAGITFLERFDFNQAARAIVTGLNAAIDEIEWDKIGRLLADAFGGVLQFFRTATLEFDWVKLGTSFAEGLNEFVRVMLDKILHFEWEQIGQGIADGVNAAVSGIGWNSFGTLVGRLIGGALKIAASFIRGLDYEEIKKSIEEFFSSALRRIDYYDLLTVWGVAALIVALKTILAKHPVLTLLTGAILALGPKLGGVIRKMVQDIPWEEVGTNFAGAFNGVINRIDEAITSVDWAGETAAIMVGLNSFLAGIDWASLGHTLTDAVIALLSVINTALYDFDWKGLGADIAVLIQNIDVVEILKGAARLASNIVTGLLDLINGFLETADWTELPGTILNGFLGVVTSVEWGRIAGQIIELLLNAILVVLQLDWGIIEAIAEWILNGIKAAKNYFQEAGENVANGILEGLGKIWDGIKGWIKEHIFQPFISAWEHIWQIGSPSKVMEEQGGFIISGLLNGIVAAWGAITDFFSGALEGLKATLGGAWDAIKQGASHAWSDISTALSSVWEAVKTAAGEKWDAVKSTLETTWESVKTAAGDKFNAVKETVSSAWENVKKNTSGTLSEINKAASEKWGNLKTDASKAWNEIKTSVGQTISSVKQDAVSKVTEIANETKSKWTRVRTDAVNEWNGLKSSVVSSALSVKSQVASAFQSLQGTLSGVWAGIRSAASGAMSSVSGMVSSMASSISSRVSSIQSTVSNITSSASNALSKVADKMDEMTRKAAGSISVGGLASGGFVLDGGQIHKYASGTTRAAGSLFIAGEAGPEIVGHVNGRTEVLNQSQIAGAIYGAVLAAMSEAVKTFGGFLSQQMASNTNALIAAMGQIQAPEPIATPQDTATIERLAALQSVPYQVPAYATGTVMPYEVVAEIRRQTSEITSAIHDEGEEIIQAIVSAITNHGLSITNAIGKIPVNQGQSYSRDDMAQYTINEINRRTRMNGRSPLLS